jgi:transposase
MKYTEQERLDIGRRVYTKEITEVDAQLEYNIGRTTVQQYTKLYKEANNIPLKSTRRSFSNPSSGGLQFSVDVKDYQDMTREELINELIKSKVNEARAKKGYEVKGVGADKEFISLNSKNSK